MIQTITSHNGTAYPVQEMIAPGVYRVKANGHSYRYIAVVRSVHSPVCLNPAAATRRATNLMGFGRWFCR